MLIAPQALLKQVQKRYNQKCIKKSCYNKCTNVDVALCSNQPLMERPSKIARLASLRARLPYVSQSALAAVLKIAQEEPLPSGTRRDIGRSRDAIVEERTPYGPLHAKVSIALTSGGDLDLEIQHPFAILYYMAMKSNDLSALIRATYMRRAPTIAHPWHLIIYSDEILPGNQLAYKNERKL